MAGSANQYHYGAAVTLIPIGVTAILMTPPATTNGVLVRNIGGGTLAIVNALTGAGSSASNGYPVLEAVSFDGPACFYMAAAGATAVAAVMFRRSQPSGSSFTPIG